MSKYLTFYNPNHDDQKFLKQEKLIFKNTINYTKPQKGYELFILNNFLSDISANQQIRTILQRIYGIGHTRSFNFSVHMNYYSDSISFKYLNRQHYDLISDLFEDCQFLLKGGLKQIKRINIANYKLINCYKGIRHSLYLPVRGQRTHSNAHVARYLSSGTFEYVPRRPASKVKKLSKYSRRKDYIRDASTARYNRLLTKNYMEFQKNNKHLFKHLARRNQLGVFNKIFKDKQKVAKQKLKDKAKKIKTVLKLAKKA
jgi:small subunit ribosomal protein S13